MNLLKTLLLISILFVVYLGVGDYEKFEIMCVKDGRTHTQYHTPYMAFSTSFFEYDECRIIHPRLYKKQLQNIQHQQLQQKAFKQLFQKLLNKRQRTKKIF